MNGPAEQFPFVPRDPSLGHASLAPMLPLTLIGSQSIETTGLVDSGAAVNVLPFALGEQLGFDWDQETRSVELSDLPGDLRGSPQAVPMSRRRREPAIVGY